MITISINGKTYKPTDAWHFSVKAIVNDLIEKSCLEEVKENKDREQQTKDITGMLDLCMNVKPQFTPGQEVEVSIDGKNWTGETIYFKEYINGCYCDDYESWKFARPIEDKIEPVPDLEWKITGERQGQLKVLEHIKLLTIAVNKLIAKQN